MKFIRFVSENLIWLKIRYIDWRFYVRTLNNSKLFWIQQTCNDYCFMHMILYSLSILLNVARVFIASHQIIVTLNNRLNFRIILLNMQITRNSWQINSKNYTMLYKSEIIKNIKGYKVIKTLGELFGIKEEITLRRLKITVHLY